MIFLMRFYLMNDKQKKFLVLRADGLSFDKIAIELKVTKKTLIQWSRLFQDEIKDLEFLAMQKLKEEFSNNQVQKYKQLLEHLKKFDEGIESANFSEEKVKDLFTIRNNIAYQLEQLEKKSIYTNTNLTKKCDIMGTTENITLSLHEL